VVRVHRHREEAYRGGRCTATLAAQRVRGCGEDATEIASPSEPPASLTAAAAAAAASTAEPPLPATASVACIPSAAKLPSSSPPSSLSLSPPVCSPSLPSRAEWFCARPVALACSHSLSTPTKRGSSRRSAATSQLGTSSSPLHLTRNVAVPSWNASSCSICSGMRCCAVAMAAGPGGACWCCNVECPPSSGAANCLSFPPDPSCIRAYEYSRGFVDRQIHCLTVDFPCVSELLL
jgi:hypothetical protein